MNDFRQRHKEIERIIQEVREHIKGGQDLLDSLRGGKGGPDARVAAYDAARAGQWGDRAEEITRRLGDAFRMEFLDRCGGNVSEQCLSNDEDNCSGYYLYSMPVWRERVSGPNAEPTRYIDSERPCYRTLIRELSCALAALNRVARLAETELAAGNLDLFAGTPARQQDRLSSEAAGNSVFVVHGHDEGARERVAGFLRKAGLNAEILHEKPNSGATIIEKLERHSDVAFAVILLTGDDACEGGGEGEMKRRARQNVIFEAGLFVGRLGRDRVALLYKPDVEIPSDLHGLLYTELDARGAWKIDLLKELIDAGLPASEAALLD